MNYTILDVPQRSPEWFAARLGRVTGSCAPDMLTEPPNGKTESAAKRNLRVALALERLTNEPDEETFTSRDLKRGEDMEDTARRAYEAATGRLLTTVGFLQHNTLMAGCSPDAIYLRDGVIDFKCPRPGNHYEYLRAETMPLEYRRQLTHNLWMTGCAWAEMVSYCPKFPEPLRICVRRIWAKDLDLEGYEKTLRAFLEEVDLEVQAIATMSSLQTVLHRAVA